MADKKVISKKIDLKVKTTEELLKEIEDLKKDIFEMKIDNKRKKLVNTSSIRRKMDDVARRLTVIKEKELKKNG